MKNVIDDDTITDKKQSEKSSSEPIPGSISRGGIFFKIALLFLGIALLTTVLFSGSTFLLVRYLMKHEASDLRETVAELARKTHESPEPHLMLKDQAQHLDYSIAVYKNDKLIFSNHDRPRDPRRLFRKLSMRWKKHRSGKNEKGKPFGPSDNSHDSPLFPDDPQNQSQSRPPFPPSMNDRPNNRFNPDDSFGPFGMAGGPPPPPFEFFDGKDGKWAMDKERGIIFSSFKFDDILIITGHKPKKGPRDFFLRLLLGTGTILLAGLAAVFFIANRLLRPIDAMMEGTRQMSSGNLDYRIPYPETNDQFTFIISSFNHMSERISNMFSNNLLIMGNISHDLKYYLTRLRMSAEVEIDDQELQKSFLEDIDQMTAYIDRAISAYRIGSRKMALQMESVNLSQLLTSRMSQHSIPCPQDSSIPENLKIKADKTYLGNILDNIMENARKYGTDPTASLETDQNTFRLTISNTIGKPMVKKELSLLFEPFYRGDRARAQDNPGSGLGLFISRQACEAMEFTLDADLQGNTRFLVILSGRLIG
ncbi:MAG: hypothetical protein CVV64_20245 [Candidatus Wallbacteria bacterium HGW-Wallbacteria-1]|jgi:signal transduction histidine kinase|uniref:histidine kinase n=1 Tax=Candidatus Wallbacteria bacterium HGW-Wallbacteria-1 TaxID=2013854 RepID=A0A2N1PIE6_9BACT|nr:MAG: hypothetical protein CVV64_20245 [Candidatus Wallbacteria bacterium HGW-Wallbacteria-1]